MPIVVGHQPSFQGVGNLAYGAGAGAYKKWLQDFNIRQADLGIRQADLGIRQEDLGIRQEDLELRGRGQDLRELSNEQDANYRRAALQQQQQTQIRDQRFRAQQAQYDRMAQAGRTQDEMRFRIEMDRQDFLQQQELNRQQGVDLEKRMAADDERAMNLWTTQWDAKQKGQADKLNNQIGTIQDLANRGLIDGQEAEIKIASLRAGLSGLKPSDQLKEGEFPVGQDYGQSWTKPGWDGYLFGRGADGSEKVLVKPDPIKPQPPQKPQEITYSNNPEAYMREPANRSKYAIDARKIADPRIKQRMDRELGSFKTDPTTSEVYRVTEDRIRQEELAKAYREIGVDPGFFDGTRSTNGSAFFPEGGSAPQESAFFADPMPPANQGFFTDQTAASSPWQAGQQAPIAEDINWEVGTTRSNPFVARRDTPNSEAAKHRFIKIGPAIFERQPDGSLVLVPGT